MFGNKIKKLLVGFAIFVSFNAQARIYEFEEIFKGTFLDSEMIAPDSFTGRATLVNPDAKLEMYYDIFNFLPNSFPGVGTFTRVDSKGIFSGIFNFYYSLPDGDDVLISGSFDRDRDSVLPNTGAYQYSWAYGIANGNLTAQGDLTLKINWMIATPEILPSVPEPQTIWLLYSGLLVLILVRLKNC